MDRTSTANPAAHVAAVILARGGSKGIPGKNLARVDGLSLVARSIRAARAAECVGSVWVSTDCPAIAAEARAFCAAVIDRPAALADDTASSEAGWLHALPIIRAACPGLDRLAFLQCTSPFTTGRDIDACLSALDRPGAACAFTVQSDHGFFWRLDADGFARGTNHDEARQRPRRQDLPPAFRESGAVYAVRVTAFETVGRRFCGPVVPVPVDHPGVEIDTPADLALVRALPDAHRPPPERLASVRALVMDFDGVHTDDRVTVDQDDRESVICSRADGLGLDRLRTLGQHRLLILSKEANPVVTARAAKLRIPAIQGVGDKVAMLSGWLSQHGLAWGDVLYIGNDINDLPALMRAGLSACPSDAVTPVRAMVDWVVSAPGGRGALRDVADALLHAAFDMADTQAPTVQVTSSVAA
jgi:YrbI family 3-deoxy-D-manno-octulosonate 8-phosphate phosphatase